jgi:hypothetical protein
VDHFILIIALTMTVLDLLDDMRPINLIRDGLSGGHPPKQRSLFGPQLKSL